MDQSVHQNSLFCSLPLEILLHIHSFLNEFELLQMNLLNSFLYNFQIIFDDVLWKSKCQELWLDSDVILCSNSWRLAWIHSRNYVRKIKVYLTQAMFDINLNSISPKLLPSSLFREWRMIEKLELQANQFQFFPDTPFSGLNNLKVLDLSKNQFKQLPTYFGNLKHLTQLNLSNNLFHLVPECVYFMESLQILKMDCNYLTELSSQICKLVDLVEISLENNQIRTLPFHSLVCLSNLKVINIKGNFMKEEKSNLLPSNNFDDAHQKFMKRSNPFNEVCQTSTFDSNFKKQKLKLE